MDNYKIKITIIGGSGFVGTNLCKQLKIKGYNFEIIDIKMSRQFPKYCKIGDVRNLDSLLENISGNVVVNLAAVHRDDVQDLLDYKNTNVVGAENVAKVCSIKKIKKIIFTSTVAVYGFSNAGTDENGKINPFNIYGQTKFEAEEKLRAWSSDPNNSLIIIRPTVIFGEGNRGNVYNLFKHIVSGKFIMIGNGDNKKSMAYIGNVVAFLEACINSNEKYGVFNYVDTPNLTMNELVQHVRRKLKLSVSINFRLPYWLGFSIGYLCDVISKLSKKKLSISSIRIKKFVSSTEFNCKSIELDGFIPPFLLLEGINRTLENEFIFSDPNQEIFNTE